MNKYILNTIGILLIPMIFAITWAFIQWGSAGRSLSVTANRLTGTANTINSGVKNTLAALDHPCAPGPCGLIENTSKTLVKVGDISATTQLQVKQTDLLVKAAATSIQDMVVHVDAATDSLTVAADQSHVDLQDADLVIKGFQPVSVNANNAIIDLDSILKDQAIKTTAANLAALTGTGEHMLVTADAVETKATKGYLHPSTNPFVRIFSAIQPYTVAAAKIAATAF